MRSKSNTQRRRQQQHQHVKTTKESVSIIETKVGKAPSLHYTPLKKKCNGNIAFFSSPLAGSRAEARHLYGSGVPKLPVRLPPIEGGNTSSEEVEIKEFSCSRLEGRKLVLSEIDKFDGQLSNIRQDLADDENQLVALLFGIQRSSSETLLSRLTQIQPSELLKNVSEMGLTGATLQREEFVGLLKKLLGSNIQSREVDLVFSLFDCNDSKSLDPRELQVGLKLLSGSNTTELVMKRIHTILSLSKQTVVSTQFITRFDMQLLFNALSRFWLVAEGVEKSKDCCEILTSLLDSFEWHQAKIPAETLRQKIFADEMLTKLFCVAAPMRDSFEENNTPSSPPVQMTVAQSYFLSRTPQLVPTDRPLRVSRNLQPIIATPPTSSLVRRRIISPMFQPIPPKITRKKPARKTRIAEVPAVMISKLWGQEQPPLSNAKTCGKTRTRVLNDRVKETKTTTMEFVKKEQQRRRRNNIIEGLELFYTPKERVKMTTRADVDCNRKVVAREIGRAPLKNYKIKNGVVEHSTVDNNYSRPRRYLHMYSSGSTVLSRSLLNNSSLPLYSSFSPDNVFSLPPLPPLTPPPGIGQESSFRSQPEKLPNVN